MAKTPQTFTYDPPPGLFVPELKPGATVKARDAKHARQLAEHPCFTPVQKRANTTSAAKGKNTPRPNDTED